MRNYRRKKFYKANKFTKEVDKIVLTKVSAVLITEFFAINKYLIDYQYGIHPEDKRNCIMRMRNIMDSYGALNCECEEYRLKIYNDMCACLYQRENS